MTEQPSTPSQTPVYSLHNGVEYRQAITDILIRNGHPRPTAWLEYLSQEEYEMNPDPNFRRYMINSAWTRILSYVDRTTADNTREQRLCLINDGSTNDWLRLFEQSVVKCVKKYELLYQA